MTGGSKEKAEPGVLLVGVDVEQELKKDRPTERVTPARILGRSFIINLVLYKKTLCSPLLCQDFHVVKNENLQALELGLLFYNLSLKSFIIILTF